MKRTLVAATLTVVFVLALATPAFAFEHDATYEWDGTVTMDRQVGHVCNTGAAQKVEITGEGKMDRTSNAVVSAGKLTVDEDSDFVTADDATDNLTVTSVIDLCAPGKYEQATRNYAYNQDDDEYVTWYNPTWNKMDARSLYEDGAVDDTILAEAGDELDLTEGQLRGMTDAELLAELADVVELDEDHLFELAQHNELTEQKWAVQVEADQGMSGRVTQDFEAAYGESEYDADDGWSEYDDSFWFEDSDDVAAGWVTDRGDDYVGNYFIMDQHARTSDGTLKRFIDISEPFDGAYLHEDFEVTGEVDVSEGFTMTNVAAGEEIETEWHDLF